MKCFQLSFSCPLDEYCQQNLSQVGKLRVQVPGWMCVQEGEQGKVDVACNNGREKKAGR